MEPAFYKACALIRYSPIISRWLNSSPRRFPFMPAIRNPLLEPHTGHAVNSTVGDSPMWFSRSSDRTALRRPTLICLQSPSAAAAARKIVPDHRAAITISCARSERFR